MKQITSHRPLNNVGKIIIYISYWKFIGELKNCCSAWSIKWAGPPKAIILYKDSCK